MSHHQRETDKRRIGKLSGAATEERHSHEQSLVRLASGETGFALQISSQLGPTRYGRSPALRPAPCAAPGAILTTPEWRQRGRRQERGEGRHLGVRLP